MEKNPYVANKLLDIYIKCGRLLDARGVFDEIGKKSVITWNKMIAGYAKSGHAESALELFKLTRQEDVRYDEVTYMCILKTCASPCTLEWGKDIHRYICQAGCDSDVRIGTALLQMYAKCGCITEARQVFDRMQKRTVVTWTAMISGSTERGCGHEAYTLFLQMQQQGFKPDMVTYTSVLKACSSAGALGWGREVHDHARKSGLELDVRLCNSSIQMYVKSGSIDDARLVFDRMGTRGVVTGNTMISGLAQHGCEREAYRLYLQMRRDGFEPDEFTYASILDASARAGALEWGKDVHGHVSEVGMESDLLVGTSLVHMYAKSGSINDSRLVFDRRGERDIIAWNTMISGLAQHGCAHEALNLFRKMKTDLVKPDGTTFAAVLSACSHGGLVDDGRRLISDMTKGYGIKPDIVHYSCMEIFLDGLDTWRKPSAS